MPPHCHDTTQIFLHHRKICAYTRAAAAPAVQLRDIEDVMRAEELRQLQLRGAPSAAGSASGGSCRARVASAPAMPYSRWWANKVAL